MPRRSALPTLLWLVLPALLALAAVAGIHQWTDVFRSQELTEGKSGLDAMTVARIVVGTAFVEEVAFRGVVLAGWASVSRRWAVLFTSVAFALWHVVAEAERVHAARDAGEWNLAGYGTVGLGLGGLIIVSALVLCPVRLGARSVYAPALLHAVVNLSVLAAVAGGS